MAIYDARPSCNGRRRLITGTGPRYDTLGRAAPSHGWADSRRGAYTLDECSPGFLASVAASTPPRAVGRWTRTRSQLWQGFLRRRAGWLLTIRKDGARENRNQEIGPLPMRPRSTSSTPRRVHAHWDHARVTSGASWTQASALRLLGGRSRCARLLRSRQYAPGRGARRRDTQTRLRGFHRPATHSGRRVNRRPCRYDKPRLRSSGSRRGAPGRQGAHSMR